ncbi:putative esterase D [Testicularia cyperi]|uniref:S-formylglutathione hydrolase n=1 Tax=Testicularia cyperi TaxID=1882483 RepID=A0A317XRQ6_9BASI|nr:putative esterase D [Testicularia cyperi]
MSFETKSTNKVCGGKLTKYSFASQSLGGLTTNINVFLPADASSSDGNEASRVPVLYFLAGLTCTEDNAAQKGGFFHAAAQHNIALVFPDTSPRGAGAPAEDDAYDFGTGAGFYLDATADAYSQHYNMYSYIVRELPALLEQNKIPIDTKRASITGHSMGGHGALTIYLKNHSAYKSCSAFSPICNPTNSPWGKKAFEGYLAHPASEAEQYDATLLLKHSTDTDLHILIHSGTADDFYKQNQLLPEHLADVANDKNITDFTLNLVDGYDHSYFFISTFAPQHVEFHAKFLNA